jgi:ribosomal protein S18 acetylase RimI-like enzyme
MGGTPLYALNIVGFPINDLPKEILQAILQGGADKAKEAGIPIVGGHSVDDKEPKYGMVVTGEVQKNRLVRNSSAKPGDALILTKPLGTGIIATAIKKGKASEESITAATKSMATLNKAAADAMKNVDIHAATDVTGYGLLGHLLEMCKASGVSAEVNFGSLEFLPGKYAAPNGCILLAKIESVSVGCAALRPISNNVCEMKRLYVKPDYRGNGLGRKLAYKIVQLAIEKKYLTMQLDTLSSMHSAIGLYQSLGFVETTPYYNNPHPDVMFFEKTLDGAVVT